MKRISLNGEWNLKGRKEGTENDYLNLTASVPGMVQLDMSRAGILPADLLVGMNILKAERYEDHEWFYERTFDAPKSRKNVFLVFRGVDCIAEYFLNGVKFGESDNMFISHEFDVSEFLRDEIHSRAGLRYIQYRSFGSRHADKHLDPPRAPQLRLGYHAARRHVGNMA